MTDNIVIGVPFDMKLYSISETRLQVVRTLLRIGEVRSIVSWVKWDKSAIGTVRGLVICVQLFENLHGRISSYLKIWLALFRLQSYIFIFILGNVLFLVCLLTFPFLTTCRPIILCYLWLSSEFFSTWPFYILLSRILCWKRPTLSTLLSHVFQNLFYLCLFL